MTIGERIKISRLKKGYTQTEMAKLLGYKSRSSINKIEVGGRDIPRSSVVKFAELLDVTPAYILGYEAPISEENNKEIDDFKLTEQEKELIKQIRGFDESVRNDLLKYISDLYEDRDEIPNTENEIEEKAN